MKFGTQGSGNGQLCHAWGMCLSSNGNVYVAEYTNSRVQVFNPDSTFSYIIKAGAIQHPQALALDPSGNLHIADHSCIKVFTADGNHIRRYGSGHLQGPTGIVVDQDGYCLVGDYNGKALTIFDSQGTLVHFVPNCPAWGVTLDKEGFVYAALVVIVCINSEYCFTTPQFLI